MYYTKSEEFHALWDKVLPAGISADVNGLAGKIVDGVTLTQYQTTGDYHHWAETWAGDSMNAANAAYAGITFNSAANVPDPRHAGKTMLNISITLPAGYKAAHQPRAKDQLSQAAVHLAQLLPMQQLLSLVKCHFLTIIKLEKVHLVPFLRLYIKVQ